MAADAHLVAQLNEITQGFHIASTATIDDLDVAAMEIEIVPTADPLVKWELKMSRPVGGILLEDPVKKVIEVEDVLLVLGYEWK